MKKKLFSIALIVSMVFSACAAPKTEKESVKKQEADQRKEIVWTIEKSDQIPQKNIDKLNQALKQKGYNFYVTFDYIEYEIQNDIKYSKKLKQKIKNKETDLFFCGWKSANAPWLVNEFLNSGLLYPLNDWLRSGQGRKVYQLYDPEIWKSGAINGKIYGFPNEKIIYSEEVKAAFNKKYISEKKIKNWDGNLKSLMNILDHTRMKKDEIPVAGFPSWTGFTRFASSAKYLELDNFYVDLDKMVLYQPFEVKEFYDYLAFWNECYKKGYVYSVSMDGGAYSEEEFAVIEQKKYAVTFEPEENEDSSFVYKTAPFCIGCNTGSMTGISNRSEKKEECLELMKALRTDDTLADLLVWGDTAENIQGSDGYAADTLEPAGDMDLGLADGILQESGQYPDKLREYKKQQLSSPLRQKNTIIGFQPDYSGIHKEMKAYLKAVDKYKDCWKEDDFKAAYQRAEREVGKAPQKVLKKLNQQMRQWKKEKEEAK